MNEPEYRQNPKKSSLLDRAVAIGALGLALLFSLFSAAVPNMKLIGNLLTCAFLYVFIQVTARFLLTQVSYLYHRDNLILLTKQGKKEKRVGSLEITSDCKLYDKEAWNREKQRFPLSHKFSYCQHFIPQSPYYLLCPSQAESQWVLLIFEPDDTLRDRIASRIRSQKEDSSPF